MNSGIYRFAVCEHLSSAVVNINLLANKMKQNIFFFHLSVAMYIAVVGIVKLKFEVELWRGVLFFY